MGRLTISIDDELFESLRRVAINHTLSGFVAQLIEEKLRNTLPPTSSQRETLGQLSARLRAEMAAEGVTRSVLLHNFGQDYALSGSMRYRDFREAERLLGRKGESVVVDVKHPWLEELISAAERTFNHKIYEDDVLDLLSGIIAIFARAVPE